MSSRRLAALDDRLARLDDELRVVRDELSYHRSLADDAARDAAVYDDPVERENARITARDVARFEKQLDKVVFVSATPGKEEKKKTGAVVQQLIRPTGLLDPPIEVRPTEGQIENLYAEIRKRIERNERVLVTTLTKKMAEDLTDYLLKLSTEEIQVNVVHKGVGQITESDVLLATASDAIIVGFQVRPSLTARKLAEAEEVAV